MRNQYVSMIGYCPQYDALNEQLTGSETLKLMAILRGISPSNAMYHVNQWIENLGALPYYINAMFVFILRPTLNVVIILGLEKYKHTICGNYSGGNKRKLNTAMALIGDPPVVFLDEPTSGVDPVARRNLWKLLAASRKGGQAVVLTSHRLAFIS